MAFNSSAITHVGMVRKLNEDAYAVRSDMGVWAVADGMGGHAAGEVASKAVTDAIMGLGHANNFDEMHEAVKRSLIGANRQLLEQADNYEDERVPGATVVVLIIDGNQGAVVWCGDSRIYRYSDQQLVQLTRDHSHVQELVDQGLIKAEDAESHSMANVITRAIGIVDPVEIDSRMMKVEPDDQFLLCSDGLSRMVSDEEIESIMTNKNSDEIVQSLLHTALVRGATDNVTIICVQDGNDKDDDGFDDEATVVQRPFT
ncbi:MAG: protein phosphatase 2C domain-containing protein [Xanthomonadales bacterium]|nr:protein phosphatase 2C domain-containing protein [Xanthomonadales bacterium]